MKTLTQEELRVLGALMEKEIATPETYPLSLNALVNACNQRSSRDPVMDLNEDEVREALDGLEARELTARVRDSRVPKFEHRARTVLQLRRDETALLCLLLLRGPQTPGELRSRSERLFAFEDLAAVQAALDRMASGRMASRAPGAEGKSTAFEGGLVTLLPRQPGSREARYAHLLGDAVAVRSAVPQIVQGDSVLAARLELVEAEVVELRERLNRMEQLPHRVRED